MDAQNFQRREGRRNDCHHHPPTTTTPLPTSTGDHASHLHHQNPTPALPTAGDRHHHRLLGNLTLLPTKAENGNIEGSVPSVIKVWRSCHPQIQGSDPIRGAWHGKFREVVPRATATADVRWWSSSGVKIWRGQWREPSIKSRGWEKKSSDHATVKDSLAAAKVSYGTNSFAKTSGNPKRQ
ncbi:hypothetical protein RHGRI_014110 [Rhododendron griersonianum]|uniref:Uncharacterized protein n=1 Tax=Rhododendron griersonianum TaxID=479676 RepID=A0AAV6K8F3_9ERIC|nr:hypothetical protein RHGRI_014110 [Rhododendron griersonianum]